MASTTRRTKKTVVVLVLWSRLKVGWDPEFLEARAGDVKHSWADISATKRDLGYEVQVPWREGLAPTIDYYAQQTRLDTVECG